MAHDAPLEFAPASALFFSSASRALLRQAAISSGLKNLIFVIALCVGVVLMAVFDQIVSGLFMEYAPD